MKITEIDYLAYNFYLDAYRKNPNIDYEFVNNIDKFTEFHKKDSDNCSFYYEKAKLKLRKIKLNKLNEAQN